MGFTTSMRAALLAALVGGAALPGLAHADDPNDPSMRSAAARARDHEATRRLNLDQAAMVRERDARYAQGWRSAGNGDYAAANAQYQRDLEQWRRAVSACRAGDYGACAR
jgi:hypothetical protein